MRVNILILSLFISAVFNPSPAYAEVQVVASNDLFDMDIVDLMELAVTTASRKSEKLVHTSSAVYVITSEAIRNSGATTIPEALRLAPGLQVARMGSHSWAITSRGFNNAYANKLLVLIDGRSVYTPLFAGVYWDEQDTLMEDIDRIEVVRGPGGTMWGANAVNGVINIITKKANETEGTLTYIGGGDFEKKFAGLRYGGKLGENSSYRMFTKYDDRGSLVKNGTDENINDDWDTGRFGFRIDSEPSSTNTFMLQGDIFKKRNDYTSDSQTLKYGGDIVGNWSHTISEKSKTDLQFYYDRTEMFDEDSSRIIETLDLDFQHHLSAGDRHDLSWGAGMRNIRFDNENTSPPIFYDPAKREDSLTNVFLQDKIAVSPGLFYWTVGAKVENNPYTGVEYQPNTRFLYTPGEKNVFWGAVSRATKTPTRADMDMGMYNSKGGLFLVPKKDMASEILVAYELGHRAMPSEKLSFDTTIFYNDYDKLETTECGFAGGSMQCYQDNQMYGTTHGFEAAANWSPVHDWVLTATYTFLEMDMKLLDGSESIYATDEMEWENPKQQARLNSYIKLPYNMQFDLAVFHSAPVSFQLYTGEYKLAGYTRVDTRLSWNAGNGFVTSLFVQDVLNESGRGEYKGASYDPSTDVERNVYLKVSFEK